MNMIERVARALCARRIETVDEDSREWHLYVEDARIAVSTIFEQWIRDPEFMKTMVDEPVEQGQRK